MATPRLVAFDETYRDRSFDWLTDPELARLTRTPPPSRDDQHAWFAGLAGRTDYVVWGIECGGQPAGACGLRHLGAGGGAESFLYLGERRFWGRGVGGWVLDALAAEAVGRGLSSLTAVVGADNKRSLTVHRRHGYAVEREDSDTVVMRRPL
jgi:RimJ/RimL family protein N-acetyltransferase